MTTIGKTLAACAVTLSLSASVAIGAEAMAVAQPAPATESAARPLDHIVAVVNTDVITEFELQARVHQTAMNLRRQNVELPPMEALRRQVLDRLITEKAIQQHARELNIRVDEQMVTAAIGQIARNNKMNVEELRAELQRQEVPFSEFRKQIRDEIMFRRLREREVDNKIEIPESEIDAYLAEKAGFTAGETQEYRVQHILLTYSNDTEKSAAQDLAKDIIKRANKGEDFGKLAATYSKSDTALSGGDFGWKDASSMPSIFWRMIATKGVKTGSVTMAETADAIHILRLAGERDGVTAKLAGKPVEQTHVRQILMFVSDLMPESEVLAKLTEIKHQVESKKADFATFARLHSVDTSATKGGDLGWIIASDAPPEFAAVMAKLAPGELSDPIRSQFGYHLIQVLDRRTQKLDATRQRLVARQELRERKLNEAVQTWQREIHDRAYVEIRQEHL